MTAIKVRKQGGKHALASIGQSSYLANGWLPSKLSTTQISVKSTAFYPYFGFYFHYFPAKVGIKCCRFYRDLCCTQLLYDGS